MKNIKGLKIDYSGSSGVHVKLTSMPDAWRVSHGSADSFQRSDDHQTTRGGATIPVPPSGELPGDPKKVSRRTTK